MTSKRSLRGGLVLIALLSFAAVALGGKGPSYKYGVAWWQEYTDDKDTGLLVHFGVPQVSEQQKLREHLKKEKQFDSENILKEDDDSLPAGIERLKPGEDGLPPVDETKAPAGYVLDYSHARKQLKIADGFKVIEDGRFGKAMSCDGKGGMRVTIPAARSVECWVKIAAYPAAESCIFSVAGGESQLLLRPDGRLEFRLRKPHGNVDEKRLSPELVKTILAKDANIISPNPLPLNEWTHVAIWDKPHPAPGNTSPFDARLKVNGFDVAWYISEGGNNYNYLGQGAKCEMVIANSAEGKAGFAGIIDEVRASTGDRDFYERPLLPWREAGPARPLQFDKPFFRNDGAVLHASLDKGFEPDIDRNAAGKIDLDLRGKKANSLTIDGVRGKGWLLDPAIGFPRVPVKGFTGKEGSLEFWLRPVNWDDSTGYWQHSPPDKMHLSVARLYGRSGGAKNPPLLLSLTLPRAHDLERTRIPLDGGHWMHCVLTWNADGKGRASLFIDGKYHSRVRMDPEIMGKAEVAYVEFGVTDDVQVIGNAAPLVEIDEIVAYNYPIDGDEVKQAHARWKGPLEPIKLYRDSFAFKYSLQKLEYTIEPLLPRDVTPQAATVNVVDTASGKTVLTKTVAAPEAGKYHFVLSQGDKLAEAKYRFDYRVQDAAAKTVIEGSREWNYQIEPWRGCKAGILDKVPPPWTPITVEGRTLQTRMTRYVLAESGLPAEIYADGVNILAGAMELREGGAAMTASPAPLGAGKGTELEWTIRFAGKTADVEMLCRLEYDGMIRYELAIKPKGGPVAPIALSIPIKPEFAKRYMYTSVNQGHCQTAALDANDPMVFESRTLQGAGEAWREYQKEKAKNPKLEWDAFWRPRREKAEAYDFVAQLDVNDMNRGLLWFCDNAAGWWQSKKVSAARLAAKADRVEMVFNLVAEETEYKPARPIVFAILPHPAKPIHPKYRLFERVDSKVDPVACSIYDAFLPWPIDPREHSMHMFPAADPKNKAAGASWEYAQSCIPTMKSAKPVGTRTMYLSRFWLGCRAGAYDNWEWRTGETMQASLTPSFVDYLCWEMDEWIRRGIFDAVYFDECYENPVRCLEAGLSVQLPDGTEQAGIMNFGFRELMKRWRGIFIQRGVEPIIMAHHTKSWQYGGFVFCDSTLDGENTPIVSLRSRDWMDSTSLARQECIQNARLWGISTFYMPFIAEGGFDKKTLSQFTRWQWRMGRQAQAQFAHYETATVYEAQGKEVYQGFWKDLLGWGAGDANVPFFPYWDNAKFLKVEGQGSAALVSFYKRPGSVFLIATNRRKQEATLEIKLDLAAMGLKAPTIRTLDSTFEPAAGEDFTGGDSYDKAAQDEVKSSLNPLGEDDGTAEGDKIEKMFVDTKAQKASADAKLEPKLDGDKLTVPVRARDYRVIVIESK